MKNTNENKWIEYAYGEIDAHEAEVLRQELAADAEAAKFVADFEALRQDMKALDEVPEHQLSTERLRHAILNVGLHKERKRANWLSWIWMPATAAALTFTLMNVMNRAGEPQLVGIKDPSTKITNPLDSVAINDKGSSLDTGKLGVPSLMDEIKNNMTETSLTQPDTAKSGSVRQAPRKRHHTPVVSKDDAVKAGLKDIMAGVDASKMMKKATATAEPAFSGLRTADASPTQALQNSNVQASPQNEPIILIGAEKDANTGARKATEVSSSSVISISG